MLMLLGYFEGLNVILSKRMDTNNWCEEISVRTENFLHIHGKQFISQWV